MRALGVKELNYKMNFLANNVTVLGLADGLDGEPAELSKTEQEEIKRMMGRRNLYQVTCAVQNLTVIFNVFPFRV